jgi:hypothetical protein
MFIVFKKARRLKLALSRNGAFNVLINMLRRVGNVTAATIKDLETTFRGNFKRV